MSFAHDGVRQNISMSDMIKYLTTNSSPSATSGGLLGMNEVFGVPQYSEFNAQHDTGGLYSVRNAHTGLRGGSSSGSFSTENKLTFSSVYGRYRSGSTGTPSNQTIPTVTLDTATANSHGSATNLGDSTYGLVGSKYAGGEAKEVYGMSFLDSPSTTSNTEYKVYIKSVNASTIIANPDSKWSITAMEVLA